VTATAQTMPSLLALQDGEQYRFRFDMRSCVGCHSCEVACAEQNGLPVEVSWRRVGEIEGGDFPHTRRFNLSMACNHCLEPACMIGCPTEAYVKLTNGIVQHLADECIGCQYCTWNCPYSVPVFHAARKIVSKCDMCKPRLDAGFTSACVDACPTKAITIQPFDPVAWRDDPHAGNAPNLPDVHITLSTTAIVAPPAVPLDTFAASDHDLQPQHVPWSLLAVTLLVQIAVGCVVAALMVAVAGTGDAAPPARLAAAACIIALPASLFHLGRPLRAWKAVRGWRRSWLSREVIGFGALAAACCGAALWPHLTLLTASAAVGGAAVYASARLYVVPGRPAWNSWHTIAQFELVAVQVGLVLAVLQGVDAWWARLAAAASVVAASFVFVLGLRRLRRGTERAWTGAYVLSVDRFRPSVIGVVAMSVVALLGVVSVAELAVGAVVCAAVLQRHLFYATVVPLSVPGAFRHEASR
jgi:formate dehydrogenase iron-sulfur subunit